MEMLQPTLSLDSDNKFQKKTHFIAPVLINSLPLRPSMAWNILRSTPVMRETAHSPSLQTKTGPRDSVWLLGKPSVPTRPPSACYKQLV